MNPLHEPFYFILVAIVVFSLPIALLSCFDHSLKKVFCSSHCRTVNYWPRTTYFAQIALLFSDFLFFVLFTLRLLSLAFVWATNRNWLRLFLTLHNRVGQHSGSKLFWESPFSKILFRYVGFCAWIAPTLILTYTAATIYYVLLLKSTRNMGVAAFVSFRAIAGIFHFRHFIAGGAHIRFGSRFYSEIISD